MTVRSRHVVALRANPPATGDTTLYTVPADRTLLIHDVRVEVLSGTGTCLIYVATAGGGVVTLGAAVANGGRLTLGPDAIWLVLEEGDTIHIFTTAGIGLTDVWVSGALLAGDPA